MEKSPTTSRRSGVIVATLALCGTIVSLQQTLVLPLLPDFPQLLGTTASNASWVVTATLVAGAVATPSISRLADMFGKKRMLITTLALTVLGSVVGAVSSTLAPVLVARALQGVGIALVPVGIATMRDELPRERIPLGVALMSATLAIGAGIGMPLAGVISEHLDWHAIFWVTGALGVVMLVAVALTLRESPTRPGGSFDIGGAVLLSGALTALLLALSKGDSWGWSSPLTLGLALTGVVLLGVWLPVEMRLRHPLVDVRVAVRPTVLLVNIAGVLTGFAMFANMLVTTQLLQLPTASGYGLGLDVLHTGLWMMPSAVVFGVMAPISAAVIRRSGPELTLFVGALLMAGTYVARVFLTADLWQIVTGSVLVGIGTSMAYAAMPTLIMRSVPVTETASANGLNSLLRSVGTSTASAAIAAASSVGAVRVGAEVFPSLDALVSVFWVSAVVSLLAGLVVVPMFRSRGHAVELPATDGELRAAVVAPSHATAAPTMSKATP